MYTKCGCYFEFVYFAKIVIAQGVLRYIYIYIYIYMYIYIYNRPALKKLAPRLLQIWLFGRFILLWFPGLFQIFVKTNVYYLFTYCSH